MATWPGRAWSAVAGFFAPRTAASSPTSPPRSIRLGGAGTSVRAGYITDLDHNTELRGDRWYGTSAELGVAGKMVRDPHVRQSLAARSAPLLGAFWDFDAASEDPLDQEAADFARWCFFERLSWSAFLRHALLYHRDGFALFEFTDDATPVPQARFRRHPGRGSGVAYTGAHYVPARTLHRWGQSTDDPTRLDGIVQYVAGADTEPAGYRAIDAGRLLRFTQEQEGADYAGFPTLRSAYGAWKTKITLMVLDAIRHERRGVGLPMVTLPEGAGDDEIDKAEEIAANMRSRAKGYAILPNGYKFEWSGGGDSTDMDVAIERCNRDIAFNVGAGFTLLGLTGQGPGSYALAQTQQGQYEQGLETDARFILDVINRGSDGFAPIEHIVRANYGDRVGIPRLVVRNMPTRDWSKLLPIAKSLVDIGWLRVDDGLEDFARSVMYLPRRSGATRALAAPAQPSAPSDVATGPALPVPTEPATPAEQVQPEAAPAGDQLAEPLNAAQIDAVFRGITLAATRQLPRETVVATLAGALVLPESVPDRWLGEVGRSFFVDPQTVTPPPAKPGSDPAAEPQPKENAP